MFKGRVGVILGRRTWQEQKDPGNCICTAMEGQGELVNNTCNTKSVHRWDTPWIEGEKIAGRREGQRGVKEDEGDV